MKGNFSRQGYAPFPTTGDKGQIYPVNFEGNAPPEFGIGANVIKTKYYDLTNARDLARDEIGGTALWCVTASSLTAYIDVYFNDQQRDPVRFRLGMFIRGTAFSRIYTSHAAQAGEYLTLLHVREEIVTKFEIANPAQNYNWVSIAKSQNFVSIADVACGAAATTLVLAANALRRTARVSNLAGNPSTIRVGDAAAGAAEGSPVIPGDFIELTTTDDIYVYNPGIAQNVAISYTTD